MSLEIKTLADLEEVAKLIKKYKLDTVKIGNIELTRSLHVDPISPTSQLLKVTPKADAKVKTSDEIEDDLLFYSAIPGR